MGVLTNIEREEMASLSLAVVLKLVGFRELRKVQSETELCASISWAKGTVWDDAVPYSQFIACAKFSTTPQSFIWM